MPWIDRIDKTHNCQSDPVTLPTPQQAYHELNANLGSMYECDKPDCKRRWKLADSQREGLYWEEVT